MANKLEGYEKKMETNPYEGFIQRFPYPTYMEVDARFNPKMIPSIFAQ